VTRNGDFDSTWESLDNEGRSPTNNAGVIRTPPGSGVTHVPVGPFEIGTKHYFVLTVENGTLSNAPSSPPVSAVPTVSESMKQLRGFHFTTVPA
jgi:hypothetical protein